ncbi:MAG: hypothetical protein APF84_09345 [Gracilibacter sp. BRH_c7a]|nr:MAG: hypothetical protein APF84_09345 [Gracilibacter sp. BRH_c7a]
MKKINYLKMLLDIAMAVVFVFLFNKRLFTGLSFHEIAGLAVSIVFIVHILLNWKWVKAVTLKIFSKISIKSRIGYMIDVLLLFSMGFIIYSGLAISTVVPLHINVSDPQQFYKLHVAVSYISLLLLGVHVGLHWNWAMSVFNKIFHIPQNSILKYAAISMVVLVLIYGCYTVYTIDFFTRATSFTVSNEERQALELKKSMMDSQAIDLAEGSNGKRIIIIDGEQYPDAVSGKAAEGTKRKPVKIIEENGLVSIERNVVKTVSDFLAIIAVFAIITYYMEKILKRRKTNVTEEPVI